MGVFSQRRGAGTNPLPEQAASVGGALGATAIARAGTHPPGAKVVNTFPSAPPMPAEIVARMREAMHRESREGAPSPITTQGLGEGYQPQGSPSSPGASSADDVLSDHLDQLYSPGAAQRGASPGSGRVVGARPRSASNSMFASAQGINARGQRTGARPRSVTRPRSQVIPARATALI